MTPSLNIFIFSGQSQSTQQKALSISELNQCVEALTKCGHVVHVTNGIDISPLTQHHTDFTVGVDCDHFSGLEIEELTGAIKELNSEVFIFAFGKIENLTKFQSFLDREIFNYIIPIDQLKQNIFAEQFGRVADFKAKLKLYKNLSLRDEVTDLFNIRMFEISLDAEFQRAKRHNRPMVLALIDLDDFKKINDEEGHLKGNEVLRAIGLMLGKSFRKIDHVFRIGGDEFAVLLPDTTEEQSKTAFDRIQNNMKGLGESSKMNAIRSLSIGVTEITPLINSPEAFFEAADLSLRKAKKSGKNCIQYSNR